LTPRLVSYYNNGVNRPRKDSEIRKVYSVRLPADLVKRAREKAGSLTAAIIQALREWLDKGMRK